MMGRARPRYAVGVCPAYAQRFWDACNVVYLSAQTRQSGGSASHVYKLANDSAQLFGLLRQELSTSAVLHVQPPSAEEEGEYEEEGGEEY